MMRKNILFYLFCFSLTDIAFAQVKSGVFKDGTEIQYEVIENTVKHASKSLIKIGLGTIGIGYQYVNPNKFEISGSFSLFSGGQASVLYSLYKFNRERNISLKVKEISGYRKTTSYLIRGEKVINTNFIGVHLGARYFNEKIYLNSLLRWLTEGAGILEKSMFPYTGVAIMGGIGKFKTSRMKYSVTETKTNAKSMRSFTEKRGIYLDLMYYPSIKYDLYNPLSDAIEPYDDYSKIGFLFLIDNSYISTLKEGRKGVGYCYQLGVGKGPAGLIVLIGGGLAF